MPPSPMVETVRAALRGRSDVRVALLFGSFARGDASETSDVDIAVTGDVDVLALQVEVSRRVGREVDVVRLADAGVPLLDEILRDGVVVYEHAPGMRRSGAHGRSPRRRSTARGLRGCATRGSRGWRRRDSCDGEPRSHRRQARRTRRTRRSRRTHAAALPGDRN